MNDMPSKKSPVFALVDCNNFYVSCERVFNPNLLGRPVVVLSNNDGCVISRSQEAKDIGVKMAQAFFECRDLLQEYNGEWFSSNFTLYADMSERVMSILQNDCPEMEIYSIDEAFLRLDTLPVSDYEYFCIGLRNKIYKWTGLPVSIGVGKTKVLAKMANQFAKKFPEEKGVCDLVKKDSLPYLKTCPVGDLWGIGRNYAETLSSHRIYRAYDLLKQDDKWIRKHLTVMGQRIAFELKGISCFRIDSVPETKKQILCSRSYRRPIYTLSELKECVATYTARAAEKLREQKQVTGYIQVFIRTSKHKMGGYKMASGYKIYEAISDTSALIRYAHKILEEIFVKGFAYKKAGVILSNFSHESSVQQDLFKADNKGEKNDKLMKCVDQLNKVWGKGSIVFGAQGMKKERKNKISGRYTTKWSEILKVI